MSTATPIWGPHHAPLRNVEGLATVDTPSVRRIRTRLIQNAHDRTLMVVTGASGSGKSHSVGRAAEAVRDLTGIEIVWAELATKASEKVLMEDLYIQVTGFDPPARVRTADLRRELQTALAQHPRVLIVDEAQHANSTALRNLRWLHDKSTSDFAIVVVGTPTLWGGLPDEMKSRTAHHVQVDRIADADAPGVLAAFHPMFAAIDPGLLSTINRQNARGSFRWWAKFLANALHLSAHLDPVTPANAHLYLADLEGTR